MNIAMLQTAVGEEYLQLLNVTGRINELYCQISHISYRPFIGIKRGYYPWHATFNRIFMLWEIKDDSYLDWALYLDTDAYVYDLAFRIDEYLVDKTDKCLIIAPGGPQGPWDVNSGVFFINLKHSLSKHLIDAWQNRFISEFSDDTLKWGAFPWSLRHDQDLLHDVLGASPKLLEATLIERSQINYREGRFIRQILRSGRNMSERIEIAKRDVVSSLRNYGRPQTMPSELVPGGILESALAKVKTPRLDVNPKDLTILAEIVTALYRRLLSREINEEDLGRTVNDLYAGRSNFNSLIENLCRSVEFRNNIPRFLSYYIGHSAQLTHLETHFAKPPNGTGFRFAAGDPALRTHTGRLDGGTIAFVDAAAGTALFGPYISLPAGRYIARLCFGSAGARRGRAIFDVSAETGARRLAERALDVGNLSSASPIAELVFESSVELHRLEVRLFCERGFTARIEFVEIIHYPLGQMARLLRRFQLYWKGNRHENSHAA